MHEPSSAKRHFNIIDFLVIIFLAATILTLVLRSNLSVDVFSTDKETTLELQIEIIATAPLHDTLATGTVLLIEENGKTFAAITEASARTEVESEDADQKLYKVIYRATAAGSIGTKGYVLSNGIPVCANETFVCKTALSGPLDALVLSVSALS